MHASVWFFVIVCASIPSGSYEGAVSEPALRVWGRCAYLVEVMPHRPVLLDQFIYVSEWQHPKLFGKNVSE